MPKVSVIVPIYGVERYIERCARSLFEQTLDDIEYIFIDDCSPDKSLDVLTNVIEQYPLLKDRIIILRNNQNLGPSSSRNRGLDICTGDYIIFCDSDDFIERNAYSLMYDKAIQDHADIVACGMCGEDNSQEGVALFAADERLSKDSLYDITKIEGALFSSSCNKLVRRDLFEKYSIRYHSDIKMWDDLFLEFQLRFFARKTALVNLPLYHYVERENSLIKTKVIERTASQVKCVSLIEEFLSHQGAIEEFKQVLLFLKLRSKDSVFGFENREYWRSIYPESHSGMYKYVSFYGLKRIILFYLYANSNIGFVSKILELYSKFRKSS